MKTIVCGNNAFTDCEQLEIAMRTCGFRISEVVTSSQGSICSETRTIKGVEKLAEAWAANNGVEVKVFDRAMEKIGLDSSQERIDRMFKYADALVAVWDRQCLGVYHMIEEASKSGLKVFVYMEQK